MTITREIREKVIQLSKEGRGRNEIARLLNGNNLHISEGSVGNIIRASRQHDKSLQPVYSIIEQPLQPNDERGINSGIPIKKTDGSSILSGNELAVTNSNPRNGGPLSHLLCEDNSTDEEQSPPSTKPKPSEFVDFDNKPYPEFYPNPNLEPDANVINWEEKVEPKPPIGLGIDWDSDDSWDRRFLRIVMDDKRQRQQQLQEIEDGKRELEEGRQQIMEMKHGLELRENKLNEKLNEIKPLLPSVRELQNAGITFDIIMAYMIAINEKSALEGITLKQAAYNIRQDFLEYRNLQGLRRVIKDAEQRLAYLGPVIRQNQYAIATLAKLKSMGYTKRDIKWCLSRLTSKKLDTELIDVDDDIFQHPNGRVNNGNFHKQSNGPNPTINGIFQQPNGSSPSTTFR